MDILEYIEVEKFKKDDILIIKVDTDVVKEEDLNNWFRQIRDSLENLGIDFIAVAANTGITIEAITKEQIIELYEKIIGEEK